MIKDIYWSRLNPPRTWCNLCANKAFYLFRI